MAKIDWKSPEDRQKRVYPYVYLLVGSIFTMFVSFRSFQYLFAWLAPIFLIRFTRTVERAWFILVGFFPLMGAVIYEIWGGWDMDVGFIIGVVILLALLLLGPLAVDRWAHKSDIFPKNGVTTLFAPTLYVFIDYIVHLTPLGSVFSYGATQATNLIMLQTVAFTGLWGLTFLIYWTAIIVNELWEDDFDLKKAMKRPVIKIFTLLFVVAVLFGAFRLALDDPGATVRVAGISVHHKRDYWTVIDLGTKPSSKTPALTAELDSMMDLLFNLSQEAADGGAKIIFWSEGNGVYFEDDEAAFINRASNFSKTNNVYFAPCVLEYLYNGTVSENKVLFFDKQGNLKFNYQKTISWYPSNSDGVIDVIATEYGRIATAICFDLDFPMAQKEVDIALIPAFDTEIIKRYHGQTFILRAVENGVNAFRMVNKGISYAVSYMGDIRASQDFFDIPKQNGALLYADIPMKRATTVFQYLANWFMFVLFALMGLAAIFIVYTLVMRSKKKKSDVNVTGVTEDVEMGVEGEESEEGEGGEEEKEMV